MEADAKNNVILLQNRKRASDEIQVNVIVPIQPVYIANSRDIGSVRVRANDYDAAIDYLKEQKVLKLAGAKL